VQFLKLQSSVDSSWQKQLEVLQFITLLISPLHVEEQTVLWSQVAVHCPETHNLLPAQVPISTHLFEAGFPLANVPEQPMHHSHKGAMQFT
jgi:hypothetical protein